MVRENTSAFSTAIKRLMVEKNLTKAQLARATGLRPGHVSEIVDGVKGHDPKLRTLIALAKGFGLTPGQLIAKIEDTQRGELRNPEVKNRAPIHKGA